MNRHLRDMLMDRISSGNDRRMTKRDRYSKPIESDYYNVYNYRGEKREQPELRRDERSDYASSYSSDMSMDGHKKPIYLTEEDMMNWKKSIGVRFHENDLRPYIQKERINFNDKEKDYTEKEFCMTVNMLYSDYKDVLGEDVSKYVKMAKAFLEDEDSKFYGGEKLSMYYFIFADDDEKSGR